MLRLLGVFCISLTTLPALCQCDSKYQLGTITSVQTHLAPEHSASDPVSYDVSVRVGDTIYVVLYTPLLGEETVKYATGHELLVLVGERTIRYNDIVGRSFEVPIESQRPVGKPKQSKPLEADY